MTLTVTSPSGAARTGNIFNVGDSFTVNVTGPSGGAVTVDGSYAEGTINSSGSLAPPVTGTWDSSAIGCYNEVWAVNGIAAVPAANSLPLSVCIVAAGDYGIAGIITNTSNNNHGLSGVTLDLAGGTGSCSPHPTTSSSYLCTATPGGNYTLTPSLTGYTFNPSQLTFNGLSSNQTDANFAATSTTAPVISGITLAPTGNDSKNGTSTIPAGSRLQARTSAPAKALQSAPAPAKARYFSLERIAPSYQRRRFTTVNIGARTIAPGAIPSFTCKCLKALEPAP